MQKLIVVLALGSFVSVAALSGCTPDAPPPAPTPVTPTPPPTPPTPTPTPVAAGNAAAEADAMFNTRCVVCHGATGKGDGVAGANLTPKPRDYADKAWQAKITDADIAKAIVEGGTSVGLSALMPPNPDLKNKPEVVAALVAKIRSFGK